ncbi:MAG: hypothetical protein U0572_04830 [Phycisphaerales bacterium]
MSAATTILVLGMHRSGTSAFTRALSLAGAALPRTLLEARSDNPDGYWESSRMVALDEAILRSIGGHGLMAWTAAAESRLAAAAPGIAPTLARAHDRESDRRDVVVMKDPRFCLLAAAHRAAVESIGRRCVAVLLVRDAAQVARSLAPRNGVSAAYADLLWRQHVLLSEWHTRTIPRLIVRHAEFLADPVGVAGAVCELAGMPPPRAKDAIRAWVRPGESSPNENATGPDASREIFERVAVDRARDADRIDALRRDALKAGDSCDPQCPPGWLEVQSDATVAAAQLAALANEYELATGCAPTHDVDGVLRSLDLRMGNGADAAPAPRATLSPLEWLASRLRRGSRE